MCSCTDNACVGCPLKLLDDCDWVFTETVYPVPKACHKTIRHLPMSYRFNYRHQPSYNAGSDTNTNTHTPDPTSVRVRTPGSAQEEEIAA